MADYGFGGMAGGNPGGIDLSGYDPGTGFDLGSFSGAGGLQGSTDFGGIGSSLNDYNGLGFSPDYSFGGIGNSGDISLSNYSPGTGLELGDFSDVGASYGGLTAQGPSGFDAFLDSPLGKVARALISMTPAGRAVNLGLGAYNMAKGNTAAGLGGITGALTGNGLVGAGTSMAVNAVQGKDIGPQLGSTLGGMFGSALTGGNPVGGMVGAQAGGYVGSQAGRGGSNVTQDTSNFGFGDVVGGLAGLYSANQASKAASANSMDLGSMFGQNSAYAQALRQQLERRDAASGRRSQYGPREVELQAKLAEMASRSAPGIMQQNMQAAAMKQAQRNAQLNALLGMGRQSGAFDWAGRQLSDIFRQPQQTVDYSLGQDTSFTPNYGFGPQGGGEGLQYNVDDWAF